MMTMGQIIERLETIKADADYKVKNNEIDLVINDFEGFNEDWGEVDREFNDLEAVEDTLDWLEENADKIEGDIYQFYYFSEIVVCVGYTSFDI